MDEQQGLAAEAPTDCESIENSSNLMSSSENVNNENLEKELLEKSINASETEADSISNVVGVEHSDKDEEELSDKQNEEPRQTVTQDDGSEEDKYAKHLTYDEQGQAIYTDPETKYKYKWSDEKNEWVAADSSAELASNDPYENEHYRWCSTTNQWIPKTNATAESSKTETEFYRWCEETKKWIPKAQSADVTCSFVDGVHTYRDKDGADYFWDAEKNAWFPKIDDDFMARYQMNYGFIDNTSKSDDDGKKTSSDDNDDGDVQGKVQPSGSAQLKRKAQPEPPQWFNISPAQNTKVYVSNLPTDIKEEEFVEIMSKYGLIMRDPKTQKFKVKLYAEPDGQLKGDGLCDYIKTYKMKIEFSECTIQGSLEFVDANCTIKNMSKISVDYYVRKTIRQVGARGSLIFMKPKNRGEVAILNITERNICPFLNGRKLGNLMVLILAEFQRYGNMSRNCPVKQTYKMKIEYSECRIQGSLEFLDANCTINTIKNISKISVDIYVRKTIRQVGARGSLIFMKPKNRGEVAILNITEQNLCPFLNGRKLGNLMVLMLTEVRRYGNLSRNCPVKQTYKMKIEYSECRVQGSLQFVDANCTISTIQNISIVSVDYYVRKTIRQVGARGSLIAMKPKNRGEVAILNITERNICPFLNGRKLGNLMVLMLTEFGRYGNISRSCPIKQGFYYIKDMSISPEVFPFYFPFGNFRVEVTIFATMEKKDLCNFTVLLSIT